MNVTSGCEFATGSIKNCLGISQTGRVSATTATNTTQLLLIAATSVNDWPGAVIKPAVTFVWRHQDCVHGRTLDWPQFHDALSQLLVVLVHFFHCGHTT